MNKEINDYVGSENVATEQGEASFHENERRNKVQMSGFLFKILAALMILGLAGFYVYMRFAALGDQASGVTKIAAAPAAVRETPVFGSVPPPAKKEPYTVSEILKEKSAPEPVAAPIDLRPATAASMENPRPPVDTSAPPKPVTTYSLSKSDSTSNASPRGAGSGLSPELVQTSEQSNINKRGNSVESEALRSASGEITKTGQSLSGKFGNQDNLIGRGMVIPCVNREQITSGIAGQFICMVTEDVYSKNGNRKLIPKGSEVQGKIGNAANFGDSRMSASMDRIVTTKNDVIDFSSPATDGLGGVGLAADVDNRWPARIGASILLAGISDVVALQKSIMNTFNTTSTSTTANTTSAFEKMTDKILDKTINLPPIMTFDRASEINIIVAQDLWFK